MDTIRVQIKNISGASFEVQVPRKATANVVIDEYLKVSRHIPRENYQSRLIDAGCLLEYDKTVGELKAFSESTIYYDERKGPPWTEDEWEEYIKVRRHREIKRWIDHHYKKGETGLSEEIFHEKIVTYLIDHGSDVETNPQDFIYYQIRNGEKPIESLEDFVRFEKARLASLQDHVEGEDDTGNDEATQKSIDHAMKEKTMTDNKVDEGDQQEWCNQTDDQHLPERNIDAEKTSNTDNSNDKNPLVVTMVVTADTETTTIDNKVDKDDSQELGN